MEKIVITPNYGIGNVKLGMSRTEVHKAMGEDFFTLRSGASLVDTFIKNCFQVNYNKDFKVESIEVANGIKPYYGVYFRDINVFEIVAEELVTYINKFAQYDRNRPESQLGFQYIFKDINLSLWRSVVFNEETFKEEWFQNLSPDAKKEELKNRYFESIGIAVNGYWD